MWFWIGNFASKNGGCWKYSMSSVVIRPEAHMWAAKTIRVRTVSWLDCFPGYSSTTLRSSVLPLYHVPCFWVTNKELPASLNPLTFSELYPGGFQFFFSVSQKRTRKKRTLVFNNSKCKLWTKATKQFWKLYMLESGKLYDISPVEKCRFEIIVMSTRQLQNIAFSLWTAIFAYYFTFLLRFCVYFFLISKK